MRMIGARNEEEMDMQGKAVLLVLLFGIKIGRAQAMNDGHIFTE